MASWQGILSSREGAAKERLLVARIRAVFFDAGDTLMHKWTSKADRFCWLYRLAVVSNWDGTLFDQMRRTGLAGYFEAILDSSVVGSRKPETRMFEIACAATGVRPEEAVHVGDSPDADGAGALAAGVRPVLLDPLELFVDGHPRVGRVARIARLAELTTLLQG